jgi:hypothetical protein
MRVSFGGSSPRPPLSQVILPRRSWDPRDRDLCHFEPPKPSVEDCVKGALDSLRTNTARDGCNAVSIVIPIEDVASRIVEATCAALESRRPGAKNVANMCTNPDRVVQ